MNFDCVLPEMAGFPAASMETRAHPSNQGGFGAPHMKTCPSNTSAMSVEAAENRPVRGQIA
jgi:hypothetical protein